jgi:hypothetical protein
MFMGTAGSNNKNFCLLAGANRTIPDTWMEITDNEKD